MKKKCFFLKKAFFVKFLFMKRTNVFFRSPARFRHKLLSSKMYCIENIEGEDGGIDGVRRELNETRIESVVLVTCMRTLFRW